MSTPPTGAARQRSALHLLATDLASVVTTPAFGWITPDMTHDMHDGAVAQGDNGDRLVLALVRARGLHALHAQGSRPALGCRRVASCKLVQAYG